MEDEYTEEEQPAQSKGEAVASALGGLLGGAVRGVGSAVGKVASAVPNVVPAMSSVPGELSTVFGEPNELEDLFAVPEEEDNDINCDDLLELDDEDTFGGSPDLSDVLGVSREDIMYGIGKPKKKKLQWTGRPYVPPTVQGL